jgi:hypothetical protein
MKFQYLIRQLKFAISQDRQSDQGRMIFALYIKSTFSRLK